jgi:hypothetical protein
MAVDEGLEDFAAAIATLSDQERWTLVEWWGEVSDRGPAPLSNQFRPFVDQRCAELLGKRGAQFGTVGWLHPDEIGALADLCRWMASQPGTRRRLSRYFGECSMLFGERAMASSAAPVESGSGAPIRSRSSHGRARVSAANEPPVDESNTEPERGSDG